MDLALTYSSNGAKLESLATSLRDSYPSLKITTHRADLSSIDETTALCPAVVAAHGRQIDILVSNAGYGVRIQNIWEIPLEEFEMTINVNLRAGFLLAKGVVPGMRDQKWGRIVFVGSIAAYGAGINGCRESPFFFFLSLGCRGRDEEIVGPRLIYFVQIMRRVKVVRWV